MEAKLMLCWFGAKHLGRPVRVLRGAPDYHVKPQPPRWTLHEEASWRGEALRKHGEGERPTNPGSQMSLWKTPATVTILLPGHETNRTAQSSHKSEKK